MIPLEDHGFALGIIARADKKSDYLLGYFFPIRYSSPPNAETVAGLKPEDSVLIAWFSDFGIRDGEWLVLPNRRLFSRKEWPVPVFSRPNLVHPNKGFLIEYDQEEPISSHPIREITCDADQLTDLSVDRKSGHLALIRKLSSVLK